MAAETTPSVTDAEAEIERLAQSHEEDARYHGDRGDGWTASQYLARAEALRALLAARREADARVAAAVRSAQWAAFDKVLHWINERTEKHMSKGDLYDAVMEMRPERDDHSDDRAVDRFAADMKRKLATARAKGRGGWDDPAACTDAHLASLLVGHLTKANPWNHVDVANFAMMLHLRGADPAILATTLATLLAEAREQGRREMREMAAKACDAEMAHWCGPGYEAADQCRNAIRALPVTIPTPEAPQ